MSVGCPKCGKAKSLVRQREILVSAGALDVIKCLLCGYRVERNVPMLTREDEAMAKPVRACVGCGKEKTIQGRGKCGSCYHKELRKENAGKAAAPVVAQLSDEEAQQPVTQDDKADIHNVLAEAWERTGKKDAGDQPPAGTKTNFGCESRYYPVFSDRKAINTGLYLSFEESRDKDLLKQLEALASRERRTPEAQILVILDKALVHEEIEGVL